MGYVNIFHLRTVRFHLRTVRCPY